MKILVEEKLILERIFYENHEFRCDFYGFGQNHFKILNKKQTHLFLNSNYVVMEINLFMANLV